MREGGNRDLAYHRIAWRVRGRTLRLDRPLEAYQAVRLHSELVHDVAEASAADLVIGQQLSVVNQGKNRIGGWSLLGIAPALELDHRGLNSILVLRGLGDIGCEFRDVWTLA